MKRGLVVLSVALAAGLVRLGLGCVGDDPTASGHSETDSGAVPTSKVCFGVAVPTNDPTKGCAATSCDPCPTGPNQTATCDSNGQCATACATGFDDCDPAAPGCETPVGADGKNCGSCGHVCGTNANTSAASCTGGKCAFTCTDPYAHCGTDDTAACDTNLGTDPNNCAACGHSCLGGSCVSGKCQPLRLAGDPATYTGLKSLYGIVVVGNQLFGTDWYQTNEGLVYKMPSSGLPDGGALNWLVKAPVVTDGGIGGYPDGGSAPASASPIVDDGTGKILYGIFRQDSNGPAPGIWEISPTGTDNKPIVTINGFIAAIAADSTYVYFSQFWRFGAPMGIFRADRNTGANQQRYFYLSDGGPKGQIDTILVQGGSIYFADNATKKVYAATPTTLDTPVELVTTVTPPGSLQADATYLYFYDNNKFWRVKKVGGTAAEDITPTPGLPGSVNSFLVDDNFVYFVSPKAADLNVDNGQKWYAFPKGLPTAQPPFVIAAMAAADNVSAVTQDATAVYWTTYGRDNPPATPPPYSAIYKVAKPVK